MHTPSTQHSQSCDDAFMAHSTALYTFAQHYPNACKACDGRGSFTEAYDPSPAGIISLSAGVLWDMTLCDVCEGNEDVPTCALCGQIMSEEGTRLCSCPADVSRPQPPECVCWETTSTAMELSELTT